MDIEKLIELNKEAYGREFIKSLPIIRITNLTPTNIRLIELVLSFQNDKKPFQMRYEKIAEYIGAKGKNKEQTVANNILALKKLHLISTKNNSNYKGDKIRGGGSKTFLVVNIEELYNYVQSFRNEQSSTEVFTSTGPSNEVEVPVAGEPVLEVVPSPNEAFQSPNTDTQPAPVDEQHFEAISHIVFENFDVEDALLRYTKDNSVVFEYDRQYRLYRTEHNIENYTLLNFRDYLKKVFKNLDSATDIINMINIELNKLKKYDKREAA